MKTYRVQRMITALQCATVRANSEEAAQALAESQEQLVNWVTIAAYDAEVTEVQLEDEQ